MGKSQINKYIVKTNITFANIYQTKIPNKHTFKCPHPLASEVSPSS